MVEHLGVLFVFEIYLDFLMDMGVHRYVVALHALDLQLAALRKYLPQKFYVSQYIFWISPIDQVSTVTQEPMQTPMIRFTGSFREIFPHNLPSGSSGFALVLELQYSPNRLKKSKMYYDTQNFYGRYFRSAASFLNDQISFP